MEKQNKLLIYIAVASAFLVPVCGGCRERKPTPTEEFYSKEIVENAYACWEIRKDMEEEVAGVLFPLFPFEDLSFPGCTFYPDVEKSECSGKMKLEIECKIKDNWYFDVDYLLPKRGQGNITVDSIFISHSCRYSERYIRSMSGYLLADSLNPLRLRLALHKERELLGFEQMSAAFGLRLYHVKKLIGSCMENIKVEMGEYAFTFPSSRFGDITCSFYYNPGPVLEIRQIILGKSPLAERDFSVGYVNPKKTDDFWGYIKGRATAETEPLVILSDALDLVKRHLEERLPSLKEENHWFKEYEELTAEWEAANKAKKAGQQEIVKRALGCVPGTG